jgi:hypothetical protein
VFPERPVLGPVDRRRSLRAYALRYANGAASQRRRNHSLPLVELTLDPCDQSSAHRHRVGPAVHGAPQCTTRDRPRAARRDLTDPRPAEVGPAGARWMFRLAAGGCFVACHALLALSREAGTVGTVARPTVKPLEFAQSPFHVRAICPAPGERRRGYRPQFGAAPGALRGAGRAGAVAKGGMR